MKKLSMKTLALLIAGALTISITASSCSKDSADKPTTNKPTGPHIVDQRLIGSWLWTQGSDGAYYDNDGTYHGAAYGYATQYKVNADGTGTAFTHVFSTIGAGTYLEVNISSQGFFETDNQGHLGYFPLSGTYKSTSGENRALRADELYNETTGTGKSYLFQKLTFTTQNNRSCFQTTATDGTVDTYFKL